MLRNSKISFDGVFLSIYSHLVKKLDLSKLCRKKSYGALKILKMASPKKSFYQKRDISFFFFLFLVQDHSYFSLVLKFQVSKLKNAKEVIKLSIWPQKCLFFKRL